jgi:hypothetical protein
MAKGDLPNAQTFTVDADGYLTEIQLSLWARPYRAVEADGLTLELRRTADGKPDMADGAVIARAVIPLASVPQRVQNDQPLRWDLIPSAVRVERGQVLAVVIRPPTGMSMFMRGVEGLTYPGGRAFQRYRGQDRFDEERDRQLQLRVLATPQRPAARTATTGPATQPGTRPTDWPGLAAGDPVVGDAIVDIAPTETQPIVRPATSRPAPRGEWQAKAETTRGDDGKWYLLLYVFNGTNQRSANQPPMGYPPSTSRVHFAILDEQGNGVASVEPPLETSPYMPAAPIGMQLPALGSGEGAIKQFLIRRANEPLPRGRYKVVVSFPPEWPVKPVVAEMVVE